MYVLNVRGIDQPPSRCSDRQVRTLWPPRETSTRVSEDFALSPMLTSILMQFRCADNDGNRSPIKELLQPDYVQNVSSWMPGGSPVWRLHLLRVSRRKCCGVQNGESNLVTLILSPRGSRILFSYTTDTLGIVIEQTPFIATDRPWYV